MRIIVFLFLFCLLSGCGSPLDSTHPTLSSEGPTLSTATDTSEPRPSSSSTQSAGNADVLFVQAVQAADESWTFNVTVQHPDTGWEDYADGWDILALNGMVLKPDAESQFTRTLLHPHVDEQPVTRSQSGIVIPPDVTKVRVRAHDLRLKDLLASLTAERVCRSPTQSMRDREYEEWATRKIGKA
jgi:hypothetical protein